MKKKLRHFIFQELIFVADPDSFSDDDDLLAAGLNSIGIMRLIMYIETAFGVTLPDAEITVENLQTLNLLAQWIKGHQA
ncbi:MAG: acyl carrier protein [Methylococcaceae bacterium]|nr:acyl carrier protein [Methylococcaceae bacterium]